MIRQSVAVRKADRWDHPLDPSMTDADVEWLLQQPPLNALNPNVFPKTNSLKAILKHECRILHCQPGEVLAREGDYVASAKLILTGTVRAFLTTLRAETIGRSESKKLSWWQAIRNSINRSPWPETRTPEEVSRSAQSGLAVQEQSGRTSLFVQDIAGLLSANKTVELTSGEMFGEVAAMYRTPLAVTVMAETEVTLLEIRCQGLRLLHLDPQLGQQLDQHYRQYWLLQHLRETPIMRFLPESALAEVARCARLQSFGRLEWHGDYRRAKKKPIHEQIEAEPAVAIEGNLATDLVLIRSGFARLCRRYGVGWQTLAYLGKGAMFGLREIVHQWRSAEGSPPTVLQESLRAMGFVDTIFIPADVVVEYILPHIRQEELPASLDLGSAGPSGSRSKNPLSVPTEVPTGLLEFLGQHRFNNGQQAMVIDLDRCTRCDDCVRACAVTHDGNPRFVRTGNRWNSFQVVEACMHCADPVCMIGCPTGAIARNPATGSIAIHDSVCIGCGVCASSCPYDSIRMMSIRNKEGRLLTDQQQGLPIIKATKCDLCERLPSGPACQQACPHQALVRIDLGDPLEIARWLKVTGREG